MTIGTSNRTTLSYIAESTPGTTPNSPTMQLLRYTGESLIGNKSTTESEEIRDDRGTADLVVTDESVGGDIMGEISSGAYDDFFEAALLADATWDAVDNGGENTISATATGFDDSGNGFITAGVEPGTVLKFSGWSGGNASLNGYYRVVSRTAGSMVTDPAPPQTATSGNSVTYQGEWIKSGKTDKSYTVEKVFQDVSPVVYQYFRGCRVSTMNIELSIGALAKVTFGMLGLTSQTTETRLSGLTETARPTGPIMNAVGSVSYIRASNPNITSTVKFTQMSLSYDNAYRELKAIGQLGAVDVRPGTIVGNATINPYFENAELLTAFEGDESFSLQFGLVGSDGYEYVFCFPKVKFVNQTLAAGSKDADHIINADVRALIDQTAGAVLSITRITA